MINTPEVAADAARATPPVAVAGAQVFGFSLPEWVLILTAQIAGITECTWVLANNVPTTVTFAELSEALALAMQAQGAIWAEPYL